MWVRKGFCKKCGRCCNINNWVIDKDTIENPDIEFLPNGDCKFLYNGLCLVNEMKPLICKLSPRHPDDMKNFIYKDTCGFYFIEK